MQTFSVRRSIASLHHSSSGGFVDPPAHLSPLPPEWVEDALGVDARRSDASATVQAITSGPLLLLTTTVAGAGTMTAEALGASVSDAYVAIGKALSDFDRRPIRFWNFLPDPVEMLGAGLDRYMIFNTGRLDGYQRWPDRSREPGPSLPTASAVGVIGHDLVIHCLASNVNGTPVENPRQRPAWQYSPRYGPVPPCFSRATIATIEGLQAQPLLLIGGTASIVGEDSQHAGDFGAQLEETLRNVEALIDRACGDPREKTALSRLTDVRAYLARQEDTPAIRSLLAARCTGAARIELKIARLCRRELLLEIEGVATLDAPCKT